MSNKSVVLLYGLPCSGKSMVSRSLSDHSLITIDEIITGIIADPAIADFQRLADEIVEQMIATLQRHEESKFIIEMGCLVPRKAITHLEKYLSESGFRFVSVVLTAEDEELIRRIVARNAAIDAGSSDSIKVDGPDYLTRFKMLFENNLPPSFIALDTTKLTRQQVVDQVINRVGDK